MRATLRQKKFILSINKKLGIPEDESQEIVNAIDTFRKADLYIKLFLPKAQIMTLKKAEVFEIFEHISENAKKLVDGLTDKEPARCLIN